MGDAAVLLAMLPLGVAYFTVATTLLVTAAVLVALPFLVLFGDVETHVDLNGAWWLIDEAGRTTMNGWELALAFVVGVLLVFLTLHIARGIGVLHGQLAKHLLVKVGTARLTRRLQGRETQRPALQRGAGRSLGAKRWTQKSKISPSRLFFLRYL